MTEVMEHSETDVRERILVTAERLYREIGYQKTTVADIAKVAAHEPRERLPFLRLQKVDHRGCRAPVDGRGGTRVTGRRQASDGSATERLRALSRPCDG